MTPAPDIAIRNTLTTRELCDATGATARQVQCWTESGMLRQVHPFGQTYPRAFAASEVPLMRAALRLAHFPKARRGIIAAIRRHRAQPPYFVLCDPLGADLRFANTKAELLTLAKNARHGVLVIEVSDRVDTRSTEVKR